MHVFYFTKSHNRWKKSQQKDWKELVAGNRLLYLILFYLSEYEMAALIFSKAYRIFHSRIR